MKNFVSLLLIFTLFMGCSQQEKPILTQEQEPEKASIFTKDEVAKFTIAAIMNQPPSIMSTQEENGVYIVSYNRPSDGEAFKYKIKFEGNDKVIWGNSDGRWREDQYDEVITYIEKGDKMLITQKFSEESVIEKEFEKQQ
jgi:hypothetical protein